jgi:TP901 family phage tail tape measure protein
VSSTSLDFLLTATDNASPKFAAFGGNVDKAKQHLALFGKMAAVALAGAAVASVKLAADFQETSTQLVTGAGESIKNLDMVKKGILALAPAVGVGPEALAKGMYFVESAGYHAASGLTVLKAAAEGAKIGGADMTVVAQGLTTALKDYHMPASAAAGVTSELIATVSQGKTTMADLSASLQNVLPFAASLGIGMADVSGAMATMTGEGIDAAQASTMLKFTMMSMAHETPKGAKALKEIGLTAADVHDSLGTKGLAGTMAMVTDAIGKKFPKGSAQATAALADIMGGTRGMGAALALTGGNMSTFTSNIKTIGGAATEAGGHVKGWALTQEDLKTKLAQAQAALQVMAVKIGTTLIPVLTQAATYVNDHVVPALMAFGKWVSKNKDWIIPLVVVIGSAIAIFKAAKIGMEAVTVAQWLWNVALDANPIGIIITAIAALVAGLVYFFTQTTLGKEVWKNVTDFIGTAINWLWNSVINPVITAIGAIFKWLWETIIQPVANFISSAVNLLGFGFKALWEIFIKPAFDAIGAIFNWIWENIIQPIIGLIQAEIKGLGIVFGWLWTNAIKPVVDFITPAIKLVGTVIGTVFGAIGGVIKGAFDGVVGFIRGIINGIIDVINMALKGINVLIKAVDKIPGVNFPTLGTIPHLATGGLVSQGGVAVVGERGPELVSLPTGSRVHPNGSSGTGMVHLSPESTRELIAGLIAASLNTANGAIDHLGKQALQMRRQGVTA